MRLILSRKGFDSSAGGAPNPVFPDGRMLPLPIPDKTSAISYADIRWDGESVAPLVGDLTKGRIPPHYRAHLDPDVMPEAYPRQPGWRPLFGQGGAAQGHLRKQGVAVGDVFIFFGLFRHVEFVDGHWRWVADSPAFHAIWGWFRVGEVWRLDDESRALPTWAGYHPHAQHPPSRSNTLYVARPQLDLGELGLPGAGACGRLSNLRRLSAPGAPGPTTWDLPGWFHPGLNRQPLTYHGKLDRWQRHGDRVLLQAAPRGQEFVLDCDDYPEAIDWVAQILDPALSNG